MQDQWLQLKLKTNKCTQITITLKRQNFPTVQINDQDITDIHQSLHYLGFYRDVRLNWNSHILHNREELKRRYNQLRQLLGPNYTVKKTSKTDYTNRLKERADLRGSGKPSGEYSPSNPNYSGQQSAFLFPFPLISSKKISI